MDAPIVNLAIGDVEERGKTEALKIGACSPTKFGRGELGDMCQTLTHLSKPRPEQALIHSDGQAIESVLADSWNCWRCRELLAREFPSVRFANVSA